jgi:FkbM family methyltransferase
MIENVVDGKHTEILPNGIAVIRGDCGPGSWVYQTGRLDYDRGMLDFLVPHIKKDMAALDIGAFIGTHTFEYLKHATSVMSFEPNPAAFQCLSHNCPKATRLNVALGEKSMTKYWIRIVPNYGASYLSNEPEGDCLPVPVVSLDTIGILPEKIGYMKIDAEGEELFILRGAKQTILQHMPNMCMEINHASLERTHTSAPEIYDLLESYGYEIKVIPGSEFGRQLDILATPKRGL